MPTITKETESINVTDLDMEAKIQQVEFYRDEIKETMHTTGERWYAGEDRQAVINGMNLAINVIRGDI